MAEIIKEDRYMVAAGFPDLEMQYLELLMDGTFVVTKALARAADFISAAHATAVLGAFIENGGPHGDLHWEVLRYPPSGKAD